MNKYAVLSVLLVGLGWTPLGKAAEFALPPDACVVFLGDILTQQGLYADAVEAFVRVAYPTHRARFFRFGYMGATPGSLRGVFEQEVVGLKPKPTHVVVCVGLHTVNMRVISEEELSRYRSELEELVRRIQAEKIKVILVTPPSADLNRNVRLMSLEFNSSTLGPLARVVGEVASAYGAEVVDWYTVSLEQREKRQQSEANFSFSRDGLRPQAEGNALLAALLLEHWKAQPMRASITLDWEKAEVTADQGKVSAERLGSDEMKLTFEGLPIPWVLPARRGEQASAEWYARRLCQFDFQVKGLSAPGLILEADRRSSTVGREQLEKGFDLAASELLAQGPQAMRLVQLINVKNKLFAQRRVDQDAKRPVDEELLEAYETLMKAYDLYHAGYVRMLDNSARRMDLELTLKAAAPSDQDALRGIHQPRRPKVTRQGESGAESGPAGQAREASGDQDKDEPKDRRIHPRDDG